MPIRFSEKIEKTAMLVRTQAEGSVLTNSVPYSVDEWRWIGNVTWEVIKDGVTVQDNVWKC